MKEIQYKCTLLTDVVLSVKSATEGEQRTLDFIPGNNFLGIVASRLYGTLDAHDAWLLFHSGKVRYGDAHPLVRGYRSLRVPADLYYPKMGTLADGCYVYSRLQGKWNDELRKKQPKQCRSGFYAFLPEERVAVGASVAKNFAIKSAYDRESRCSKDGCMFGYESLSAGTEYVFSIEIDDDVRPELVQSLDQALTGRRHVGRSRTAQYGMVRIESGDFRQNPSARQRGDYLRVYADGRLIFHDDVTGLPTLRPDASQFHLPQGSKVRWDLSQVRTFQYAPWNAQRQAFDTERLGFEKGCVFVVECTSAPSMMDSAYVGVYNTEGFGRVIYNPAFLEADDQGMSVYTFSEKAGKPLKASLQTEGPKDTDTLLVRYLNRRLSADSSIETVYGKVNAFVRDYAGRFKGKAFASQWGTIRSLANAHADAAQLRQCLYGEGLKAYLTHGVAKEKWEEKGRLILFKEFCKSIPDEDLQQALVNLASEMAKAADK